MTASPISYSVSDAIIQSLTVIISFVNEPFDSIQSTYAYCAQCRGSIILHILRTAENHEVTTRGHLLADLALTLIGLLDLEFGVAVILNT